MVQGLALAGYAEVMISEALAIAWLSLLVICACLILTAWRRSGIWLSIGFVLLCLFTIVFQPWNGFVGQSDANPPDPDVTFWNGQFFVLAVAWSVVVLVVLPFGFIRLPTIYKRIEMSSAAKS